jgi:hypothetical protein
MELHPCLQQARSVHADQPFNLTQLFGPKIKDLRL